MDEAVALEPTLLERRGRVATTFRALETPAFRTLALNAFIMITMIQVAVAAQSVVAFDLTGDNSAVGFVLSAQGAAMLIMTLLAGAIADRIAKKTLIFVTQFLMLGLGLLLTVLAFSDGLSIYVLAFTAFLLGCSIAFYGPAQLSSLAEILPLERRGNGAALVQVALQSARMVGPLIAGGLLSIDAIDAKGTFLVLCAMSLPLLLTASRLPYHPPRASTGKHVLTDIREGLGHVLHNRPLFNAVSAFLVVTLGYSIIAVVPGFTKDVLHAGDAGFGAVLAMNALGSVIAAVLVAGLASPHNEPVLMVLTSLAFALLIALTGVAPNFPLVLVGFFFVGLTSAAFQTLCSAVFLHAAQPEYFGRVISITTLAWSLTNLLGVLVGTLADLTSERTVLVGIGLGLAAVIVLLALSTKSMQRRPEPLV